MCTYIDRFFFQVSDEVKAQVPEHIRQAAREMNRKAYEERLRAIKMSEFDSQLYEGYASQVRKQIRALKNIINSLQAKAKDRQWLKNQTEGKICVIFFYYLTLRETSISRYIIHMIINK